MSTSLFERVAATSNSFKIGELNGAVDFHLTPGEGHCGLTRNSVSAAGAV